MSQHHPYVIAAFVFFSMVLADLGWSIYIRSLAKDKIMLGAVASAFITLCGAFTTISYIENHWLLIPALTGGFVGTLLCKSFEKVIERKTKSNETDPLGD